MFFLKKYIIVGDLLEIVVIILIMLDIHRSGSSIKYTCYTRLNRVCCSCHGPLDTCLSYHEFFCPWFTFVAVSKLLSTHQFIKMYSRLAIVSCENHFR